MPGNVCACGSSKNWNAQRCWSCGNEARRARLVGIKHDEARRMANSEGQKRRTEDKRFDLRSHMASRPHPTAKPVGATFVNKEGRVWVKIAEHGPWHRVWRRRAYVVWEAANGLVPRGRLLHHINGDCGDDRLENLQMVTRAEHAASHADPDKLRAAQLLGVAARKQRGGKY